MDDSEKKNQLSHLSHDIINIASEGSKHTARRSEPARLIFSCNCRICQSNPLQRHSNYHSFHSKPNQKSYGYTWLVEKLGLISQSYSFKLNIPDIAVFHKGKVLFFLQFQRDRTIKCIISSEKLTNQEVIKQIINLVRIRKKEESPIKGQKMSSSPITTELGKETACIRFMTRGRDNDLDEIFAEDELGALKVMNESEFTGLMWQRAGSNLWKTIRYIQSVLKCNKGIGESFIHFYKFNHCDSADLIQAGMEENEEFEQSLFMSNPSKYCEFVFKKLRFLIEKFLNIIILQIKGEFLRDKNNRIWLIHASDILITEGTVREMKESRQSSSVKVKINEDLLLQHLAMVAKLPKNGRTERFSGIMNLECQKMIKESGLLSNVEADEHDVISSEAFAKLRKFAPYKLDELLDKDKAKELLREYKEHGSQHCIRKSVAGIDYEDRSFDEGKKINLSQTWTRTPRTNYTQRSRVLSSRRRISMGSTFSL